ncbi:MAG TPA: tetratricopeptide repeat protein [Thermoanaerobaculia bacterium]|nr:tetratricopeptide repeat protein [Thermoanaerobaculia bacterium]
MDRQHRRELKHDRFVDEIGSLSTSAKENQRLLYVIGAAAIAVALIAYGVYFYRSNREQKAQNLLASAIDTMESPLLNLNQPNPLAHFKTDKERNAAAEKQFKDLKAKYNGTDAADVSDLYLARIDAGRGDIASARKLLQAFIQDNPKNVLVGAARYSLYQMRIESGEAQPVMNELNAELAKKDNMILPADSLLVLLAHSYEVQGNEAKSRETYRRIVTEYPDSPFALEAQRRIGAA